ncbi:MAG TPA: methyltransferase domain-containing protein [Pirellulales bacterium]|nr:methyltransferase domain-containing protein [Pirellulales bacterium]
MPQSVRVVRFPSVPIGSFDEFEAYRQSNRAQLDGRYLYEVSLASAEPVIARPGSCALCLCATTFSSSTVGGERQPDGRIAPNWREQQYCDCPDNMTQRGRSLLHFALANKALQPWMRLMLFGRPTSFDRGFDPLVRSVAKTSRLFMAGQADDGSATYRLPADDGAFHTIISSDSLQHVPPLAAALAEFHRVLMPGGRFIFTIPFHFMSRETATRIRPGNDPLPADIDGEAHAIGWDIIDMLYAAGFDEAHAHTYWSEELGYLGPFKTIFMASR